MIKLKSIINEILIEHTHKAMWMDNNGKIYNIDDPTHWVWARNYLNSQQIGTRFDSPSETLTKKGWIMLRYNYYADNVLYFEHARNYTPTEKQMAELKSFAIENGVSKLVDDSLNSPKEISLNEVWRHYNQDASDDEKEALARQYFDVGQDDDERVHKNYCWIWNKFTQAVDAKKGGTHSTNFGHTAKDHTYSGWYDVDKNKISIVFPDDELRKLGNRRPTEDDIPEIIYRKLINKFGKRKPVFVVF